MNGLNLIWWILELTSVQRWWFYLFFQNKRDPIFYLAGQPIPITKCYTYLGIPFDNSLSLNPIIKLLNSKVTKAHFC